MACDFIADMGSTPNPPTTSFFYLVFVDKVLYCINKKNSRNLLFLSIYYYHFKKEGGILTVCFHNNDMTSFTIIYDNSPKIKYIIFVQPLIRGTCRPMSAENAFFPLARKVWGGWLYHKRTPLRLREAEKK